MPWTEATRPRYRRSGLRYASDLTDAEWGLLSRRMPPRCRRGRPRTVALRRVVEAVLFILSTGCRWRALPKEYPPYSTVQGYFHAWRDSGRWQKITEALVRRARRALGRAPKPTAAVIDSQSAPTAHAGGPRGYDAGKRIHGRKRHIVTDSNGLLLAVHVHPANVQDCHGAVAARLRCCGTCAAACRSCGMSLPTASIAVRSFSTRSPIADPGGSRSSSVPKGSKASNSSRDAGCRRAARTRPVAAIHTAC